MIALNKLSGLAFAGFSILLIILVFSILPVAAQEDIIRVETKLVAVEVSVSDKGGNPVKGLTQEDFRVFEDGRERKIDFFEQMKKAEESRPLVINFVVDLSGSITPEEMERLRSSLRKFIGRLEAHNAYFSVISFGMEVRKLQSFTNKPKKLEKIFGKIFKEGDRLSSHAYDAADDSIRNITNNSPKSIAGKFPRRAVILITDGFPVGDTVSPKLVIERANKAETSIYAIILPSYSRLQAGKKPLITPLDLSGLIEKTGGKSLYANEKDFDPIFKSLFEEITSSYVLAFYPAEEKGKAVNIRVESKNGLLIRQNRTSYTY